MSSAIIKDWRALPESREKYHLYLASRDWAVHKEAVRKRSGGICERCHFLDATQVHHQTYERKYDEKLEDLVHLCAPCHEFLSGKTKIDPWLATPVRLFGIDVRTVYLAGKITGTSWRDDIAPGWSEQNHGLVDRDDILTQGRWYIVQESVPLPDGRSLAFSGPYWRVLHDLGGHSSFPSCTGGDHAFGDESSHGEVYTDQFALYRNIELSIVFADLVFAWIDSADCYGTLVEVGMAVGMTRLERPKIRVVASPEPDPGERDDLWMVKMCGFQVHAPTPAEAWHKLWTENKAW